MFSLICARINDWVNNREAGELRRYRGRYDVIVMLYCDVLQTDPDATLLEDSGVCELAGLL